MDDRGKLTWHWALVALAAALALLALMGGCAATIACPAGTYPTRATSEQETSGNGSVSVPTATGSAGWSSEARSAWNCRRICPARWAWSGTGCVQERPAAQPPDGGVQ